MHNVGKRRGGNLIPAKLCLPTVKGTGMKDRILRGVAGDRRCGATASDATGVTGGENISTNVMNRKECKQKGGLLDN